MNIYTINNLWKCGPSSSLLPLVLEQILKIEVQIMQTRQSGHRLIQDEKEGRRQRWVFLATELTADTGPA